MKAFEIIPGCVDYVPNFLSEEDAVMAFRACLHDYRRTKLSLHRPWMGDDTSRLPFRIVHVRDPKVGWAARTRMARLLMRLHEGTRQFGIDTNSVLVNFYRNGLDSLGHHRDGEPELGEKPTILTVSLGAMRNMELRPQSDVNQCIELDLEPGSLLVMKGRCQQDWLHGIPERPEVKRPRISLTLREVSRAI